MHLRTSYSGLTSYLSKPSQAISGVGQVPPFDNDQADYVLGIHDARVGNDPSDHNYSSTDRGEKDSNRSCLPNKKMLMKKIPWYKILLSQQNLLHILEEATPTTAFCYSA